MSAAATIRATGAPRAVTTWWRIRSSTKSTLTLTSSNTTRRALGLSNRCGWCRKTKPSCSVWSRANFPSLNRRIRSSAESTRPPSLSDSTSSRSVRSADLRARRRAIALQWRTSAPSSSWWLKSRKKFGVSPGKFSEEMTPAVHPNEFAGDEVRLDKEHHRLRDLLGAAPSCERCSLDHLRILFGRQVGWRQDRPRRDRVDQHLGRELQRQRLSQRGDRSFGYIVWNVVLVARPSGYRQPIREVYDSSRTVFFHERRCMMRIHEGALRIR